MDVEYKGAYLKALDAEGKGQAIIATLNTRDRDNDMTLPLAFGEQWVKLLVAHDWHQPSIGDARLYEAGDQVLADFEINLKMHAGRELYESLKWDYARHKLQEWSYGYLVLDHDYGMVEGKRVRVLKKVEAYEISPVVKGAGFGTGTLAVKAAQRYWPGGGLTPMKGAKEQINEAVTSLHRGLRHFHHIQLVVTKSAVGSKTEEDFSTAMEHFESVLDLLNDTSLALVEPPPVITTTATALPKAAEVPAPEPVDEVPDEEHEASAEATSHPSEKGGMPIHDELESVMRSIERVTDRLEQVKAKRAEVSPRYPNGRPVSAERLGQVETLMTRLSRLKVSAEVNEQQDAEQQELQQMTERLKRLGVAV